MSKRIRVGAVNYLNTKPLIENFSGYAPHADLILDFPSKLADDLRAGRLDTALIPVIEYFRAENYRIIPNIAIASCGPVLSVTLFSRVEWEKVRSISLDAGSRSSAALTQVLSRFRYGISPRLEPLPMDRPADDLSTDAVLLIGDRAMKACLPGYPFAYDLGKEWLDWTGLPFVYAVWAVRSDVDLQGVDIALQRAKEFGTARAGIIAQREAPALGLDAGFCRRYLSTLLSFDLGEAEQEGLRRYYSLASELGLAPSGVEIEYYNSANLVESR